MRIRRPLQLHKPGDLVQVEIGKRQILGLLVTSPSPENHSFTTINSDGHLIKHRQNNILFTAHQWINNEMLKHPPELLRPASGLTEKVKALLAVKFNNIPTESLLSHLYLFGQAADKLQRLGLGNLESAYRSFIKDGVPKIQLSQLAGRMFKVQDPTTAELLTTKRLSRSGLYFKECETDSSMLSVRPVKEYNMLYEMIYTPAKNGSTRKDFLLKCEKLIAAYRNGKFLQIQFSKDDMVFVNHLKMCVESGAPSWSAEMESVINGIIGQFKDDLYSTRYAGRDTIIQLLKEIGVFNKNHDTAFCSPGKVEHLPLLSTTGDLIYQESELYCEKIIRNGVHRYSHNRKTSHSASKPPAPPSSKIQGLLNPIHASADLETSEPFLNDPLEAQRVEVTSPVFVIDSETAHELDDGISLEETNEGTWIHVHIANPTSYIPSNHILSRIAQLRGITSYFPHLHFPMMPPSLSKHILNLGTSQGALCFSARLDISGDICDYKITPTLVTNPRFISYTKVDSVLKWDGIDGVSNLEANPAWVQEHLKKSLDKAKNRASDISETESSLLCKLQDLVRGHRKHRVSKGAILNGSLDYSISVLEADMPISPHSLTSSFNHESFTAMSTISVNPFTANYRSPSQLLVEECMLIAGRVAAKFCADRKIPAAFRGQLDPLQGSLQKYSKEDVDSLKVEGVLAEIRAIANPNSGYVDELTYQKILPYQSAAYGSIHPVSHYSTGIQDGYVRTTSPLRRFQDMHTHYQIQATLLNQRLPFSAEDTVHIIERQDKLARQSKLLERQSKKYWMLEFLRRQCFAREKSLIAPDPGFGAEGFRPYDRRTCNDYDSIHTAVVMIADRSSGRPDIIAQLPYLGGFRVFVQPKTSRECQVGDEIKVLLDYVSPDRGYIRFIEI